MVLLIGRRLHPRCAATVPDAGGRMPSVVRSRFQLAPVLAVAAVVAVLGCGEDAESPTEPAPAPALATTTSAPLSIGSITAGGYYTCAVSVDSLGYCWGDNQEAMLGDGTT